MRPLAAGGPDAALRHDLARYDKELARATAIIGAGTVLLYGHSTGGLILSLWLDRLSRRGIAAQSASPG